MATAVRRAASGVLDSGPVVVLAAIAAVGSFTHIRDLAAAHGQSGWMAWAVAVCIDLLCVMAARERHRDKRTGRARRGPVSWPTVVLAGGVVLTLAANLARAEATGWGYVVAGTPAAAFLVAISMLERRAAVGAGTSSSITSSTPAHSAGYGHDLREDDGQDQRQDGQDEQDGRSGTDLAPVPAFAVPPAHTGNGVSSHPSADPPVGSLPGDVAARPAAALIDYARHIAADHHRRSGRVITRDQLRSRLRVSTDVATALLREVRIDT